jgi:hypothetical protein
MVPDTPLDAAMSYRVKLQSDDFASYADRLTEFTQRLHGEFG